jgi:subtilisin family serine protease
MQFRQNLVAAAVAMAVSGVYIAPAYSAAEPTVVSVRYSTQKAETILSSGASRVTIRETTDSKIIKNKDGSQIRERYRVIYTITDTPVRKQVITYRAAIERLSNGRSRTVRTPVSTKVVNATNRKQRTQRTLISTEVLVAAKTAPVIASVASQPALDFDPKTYSVRTYYGNNPALGTPTAVPSHDPKFYLTPEANNGVIAGINANYAYARGWTGRGSAIMIMDSGIDLNNPDFAGKIKYSIDYTGKGLQDTNGHGTHVAGIAAGARNGVATHGVAFDANLAIAKITDNGTVGMTTAQRALAWAGQYNDIVVASLSANVNYSADYKAAMIHKGNGVYVNTHKNYGGANYYNLENPQQWANALPREMVLTVSAGNSKHGYVQNPATFATATDANGNLLLGGRMLVVGNWNATLNQVEGAAAGHVCKNYINNVCNDRYQTKDFYILAPGTRITSNAIDDGTKVMSGTSQAAPVVAGAVAIVHQMWPYMKGDQMVQLLLKTANKNLPGYTAETMGAGMLDLDRATRPVGNLGISLTGRTGTTQPISGSISLPGVDSAVKATLSSVSVVDEFKRDFSVDMSSMVTRNTLMSNPWVLDHTPGQSWSAKYAGVATTKFNGFALGQVNNNTSVSLDNRAFGATGPWTHQVTLTNTNINPYVQFSGSWGSVSGSTTMEYNSTYRSEKGWWAQGGVMQTSTQYSTGMVTKLSPIYAVHGVAGYTKDGMSVYGGIKPHVVSGYLDITVPTSVDSDGVMRYSNVRANLDQGQPITYIGAAYRTSDRRGNSWSMRAVMDQTGVYQTGVQYARSF